MVDGAGTFSSQVRLPRAAVADDAPGTAHRLLFDAVQKLADAGEVDAACRIAGSACVVLRPSDAKSEHRFNALLHRLTRKLEPVRPGNAVNEPAGP